MKRLNRAIVFLSWLNMINAEPDWYDRKLEGWYYFQESKDEGVFHLQPDEAHDILEEEKRKLQEFLSLALLVPTQENVAQYVIETKRLSDQSAVFADVWGKLLEERPELLLSESKIQKDVSLQLEEP